LHQLNRTNQPIRLRALGAYLKAEAMALKKAEEQFQGGSSGSAANGGKGGKERVGAGSGGGGLVGAAVLSARRSFCAMFGLHEATMVRIQKVKKGVSDYSNKKMVRHLWEKVTTEVKAMH
jgi:hypothetical protein